MNLSPFFKKNEKSFYGGKEEAPKGRAQFSLVMWTLGHRLLWSTVSWEEFGVLGEKGTLFTAVVNMSNNYGWHSRWVIPLSCPSSVSNRTGLGNEFWHLWNDSEKGSNSRSLSLVPTACPRERRGDARRTHRKSWQGRKNKLAHRDSENRIVWGFSGNSNCSVGFLRSVVESLIEENEKNAWREGGWGKTSIFAWNKLEWVRQGSSEM